MALDLDDTNIVDMIIESTVTRLENKLKVAPDDDAKAGLVRAGRLQDDPTNKKINILIHTGGDAWPDELSDNASGPTFHSETYSIGGPYGSIIFRRRIRIEFSLFYENELSRIVSRKKALTVLHRAQNALLTWDVGREIGCDDFGERAHEKQIVKMWLNEGGGPGDFNWRGELWVEFITEIEPIAH